MKKNFLFIFAICLSLSLSSISFAEDSQCITSETNYSTDNSLCNSEPSCFNNLQSYRSFAEQIKKERSAISNALGLTEDQMRCRIDIIRKNSMILEEKFRSLYNENCKLTSLEAQNADKKEIKAQQEQIECIKDEIKKIIDEENEEFVKVLDRQQRAKLRMIQKLEHKAVKDRKKQKDYYKSNPKMRPFAMPVKSNCDYETGDLQ